MDKALLIFDDPKEVVFFETQLTENKINVLKSNNLEEALILTKTDCPDLIVINALFPENQIIEFCKHVKTREQAVSIISLVDSENYYSSPYIDHLMTKPIRPKLLLSIILSLMKREVISWYPSIL